ncbi:hypothetical protein ABW636_00685 [Aquimarina sp. 2201CG1-2-11]|uniref:hypothetical protein n=1 Tax=Aquimarina discodermiae TaxID=3231043 RepID=UPI00346217C4
MIIRKGNYTNYKGFEVKINKVRPETSNPFTHFILTYEGKKCSIEEFRKDTFGSYVKMLNKEKLQNAFRVVTKVQYKQDVFEVYNYFEKDKSLGLNTYDEELKSKLEFVELRDSKGGKYFSGTIKLYSIEKIWEEIGRSDFDLPMPQNIVNTTRILNV